MATVRIDEMDATIEDIGIDDIDGLEDFIQDVIAKSVEDRVIDFLVKDNRTEAILRGIIDSRMQPKSGLEYIQKLHGEDGYLVVQMVDQIKGNINVMRLLIGEYKYYVQFCIAVGIDLDTYSRIHDHFTVQVNQELEGTDYVDDDAVRLAIANAKPIEVNNDES